MSREDLYASFVSSKAKLYYIVTGNNFTFACNVLTLERINCFNFFIVYKLRECKTKLKHQQKVKNYISFYSLCARRLNSFNVSQG